MEITIRNAEIKDSAAIAELSNQLGYKTQNTAIQNRLIKIIGNPDHCVYVATESGKVVGWIHGFYSLRVESDFFVEIGGLVVSENYRNTGIGRKLVYKVIEWTEFRNCTKIRVRCNVIRKESHQFYEHIGFELSKEQKVFHKQLL